MVGGNEPSGDTTVNVRVIAGEFGGRILDAPTGRTTHPMGERVRGALFNSLGSGVVGARVLDVFAGTGALGFEALSRGAEHVTFVERDRIAQKVIDNNITTLNVHDRASLIRSSVSGWFETANHEQYDIIFADPPYHNPQLSTVFRLTGLLKPGALMVLSRIGKGEAPAGTNGVVVVDNRSYGNACLTFYRRDT